MRPPHEIRPFCIVSVRKIVSRHLDIQSLAQISFVFVLQRHPVILRMPHDENLFAAFRHTEKYACFFGLCHDLQIGAIRDGIPRDRRMTGMGRHKIIVKSAHQRLLPVHDPVTVQAEQFLRELYLRKTIIIVQRGLRSPADIEGGSHMRLTPRENLP